MTVREASCGGEGAQLGEDTHREDRRREDSESPYVLPEMTTVEHLTELRYRIIVSGVAVAVCSVVGWFFVPRILRRFAEIAGRLIFVAPAEAFFSHLRIALAFGLFAASPVVFWQGWKFTLPALFPHEREVFSRYLPAALILFCLGVAFAYVAILPLALRFFLGFGTEYLRPAFSIGRFLSFFLTMTLPFGILFQIPLVVLILVRLGILATAVLEGNRKYFWFTAFVVGAVLTPADVASQVLMAVPAIALYEVAILLAKRAEARRRRE